MKLPDSQTFPKCIRNYIKVSPSVSEGFGNKHPDLRILHISIKNTVLFYFSNI